MRLTLAPMGANRLILGGSGRSGRSLGISLDFLGSGLGVGSSGLGVLRGFLHGSLGVSSRSILLGLVATSNSNRHGGSAKNASNHLHFFLPFFTLANMAVDG